MAAWRVIACAIGGPWGIRSATRAATICGGQWEFVYSVGGLSQVLALKPQVVFFLNWSRKVPDSVLTSTTAVNFHCTDLRRSYGRGGHPIENLLMRGYTETVISAHVMTSEIDAGPVYGVSPPFSLAGTKHDIRERFIQPTADLMVQIVRGELQPKPQEGQPVLFQRLGERSLKAFWASRAA